MVHVPYRGSGPAQLDLTADRIQFLFDGAPGALARIKAGQAKGIAVSTLKRSPTLPELRGMDAGGWVGLFGPAQTPGPVVERLNGAGGPSSPRRRPNCSNRVWKPSPKTAPPPSKPLFAPTARNGGRPSRKRRSSRRSEACYEVGKRGSLNS